MTASAFCAVAPVSAVCAAFATQPSAYPLGAKKRTLRQRAGVLRGRQAQEKSAYGRLWTLRRRSRRKGLALFCASPSTSARSAGSFGR